MLLPPRHRPRPARCSVRLVVAAAASRPSRSPPSFVGRLAADAARPHRRGLRRRRASRRPSTTPPTRSATRSGSTCCCSAATAARAATGVRTDTVIVASIDTETGDTTLFSLPRNLEDLPFPADSPLAEVYPDGFDAGNESESLLNAVYRNGPAAHPDILGPTDNPGADFLKLGVGEALGLDIDYYVLVNLDGLQPAGRRPRRHHGQRQLLRADRRRAGHRHRCPTTTSRPGPNQHMDGATALDFARGRFGLTDYDRMDRQRCTIDAIVDAADPVTLLQQYQELAATTQDIVSTDIPRSALDDFVDLAFLVKDAERPQRRLRRLRDRPGLPGLRPDPRQIVAGRDRPGPAASDAAGRPGDDRAGDRRAADPAGHAPRRPARMPATDVADACAYDPEQAEEALDAGKPPTRNG